MLTSFEDHKLCEVGEGGPFCEGGRLETKQVADPGAPNAGAFPINTSGGNPLRGLHARLQSRSRSGPPVAGAIHPIPSRALTPASSPPGPRPPQSPRPFSETETGSRLGSGKRPLDAVARCVRPLTSFAEHDCIGQNGADEVLKLTRTDPGVEALLHDGDDVTRLTPLRRRGQPNRGAVHSDQHAVSAGPVA